MPLPNGRARFGPVLGEWNVSAEIEAGVLAAEKRRCDAMLANDNAALAVLLDPRLHFSHATGTVDDKAALLAKMAAGRIQYVGIVWDEEKVTPLAADAAMLTGRMTTDVRVEGVDKRLNNRVITVWSKADDDWRLIAFQSSPLAA
jgi:hypothetical protein